MLVNTIAATPANKIKVIIQVLLTRNRVPNYLRHVKPGCTLNEPSPAVRFAADLWAPHPLKFAAPSQFPPG